MYSSVSLVPDVPSSSDDSVFALNDDLDPCTGPTTAVDWVLRCSGSASSGLPGM